MGIFLLFPVVSLAGLMLSRRSAEGDRSAENATFEWTAMASAAIPVMFAAIWPPYPRTARGGSAVRVPVTGGRGSLRDHHRAPPHDTCTPSEPWARSSSWRSGCRPPIRRAFATSSSDSRRRSSRSSLPRQRLPGGSRGRSGSGCACRVCRAPVVVRGANPCQHRACVRRAVAAFSPASRAAVGVRLACRRDHGRVLLFRGGVLRGGRRSRVVHRSPHDRPPADSGRALRDVRPDDGGRAHGGAESRASAAAGLGRRRDADCEPRVAALPRIGRRRA